LRSGLVQRALWCNALKPTTLRPSVRRDIIQPRSKIVIVIHTRWDEDDMIGWLLTEYANVNWAVINFPALAEDATDVLQRQVGDALWPEHKSRAELEKIRDQDPINFQALYQQRPVGAGARIFKREWLEATNMNCRYDPIKQLPAHRAMNKLMLLDSANAKKKRSDYTVIWILGLGGDRNWTVLDILRDRLDLVQRGDAIFRLHRVWDMARGWSRVVYEQYGKDSDVSYLNDRMVRENYRFPMMAIGEHLNKPDRIQRLVAPISQGQIMFPLFCRRSTLAGVEEDLMQVFIEQEYGNYLVGGGGVAHDDMLDALAFSQNPDVQEALVWPRPTDATDPNEVLRRWGAQHRARGGTWAGL
jgi:hypothetical protein